MRGRQCQGFESHTIVHQVNQPLRRTNCNTGAVVFEEGDLLLDFEVFGEL